MNLHRVLPSSALLLFVLAIGCSNGMVSTAVSGPAYKAVTLHAAGTSVLTGFGLVTPEAPNTVSYPAFVAATLGLAIDNRSLDSNNCEDVVGSNGVSGNGVPQFDFSTPIQNDSLWLISPGNNDENNLTLANASEQEYLGCMRAAILHAGLPTTQFHDAQGSVAAGTLKTAGTWFNNPYITGTAIDTVTVGATITQSLPAGQACYFEFDRQYGSNATFTVSLNGVALVDPVSGSSTWSGNSTTLGWVSTFYLWAGRGAGSATSVNTLAIAVTGMNAGYSFTYAGAACIGPSNFTTDSPRVVWPGLNFYTSTQNASTPAGKIAYDNLEVQTVQTMAADGFHVSHVELLGTSCYDPTTQSQADGIHPDLAGATSIAKCVSNAMLQ